MKTAVSLALMITLALSGCVADDKPIETEPIPEHEDKPLVEPEVVTKTYAWSLPGIMECATTEYPDSENSHVTIPLEKYQGYELTINLTSQTEGQYGIDILYEDDTQSRAMKPPTQNIKVELESNMVELKLWTCQGVENEASLTYVEDLNA